ncbi:hypothetical protein [Pelolinea submarina]|uniref:Uncharacterized protein n=1 Tax=Pelolinea submarina TaxID=913107 RepID=A0A347ZUC1_9CHLR|nr:hypothetical protein [Pelolinea submarina]REG10513.1 hypothetical protein DFR64_0372 [Pelolinea submarina]BBB48902.1 hypothetical protein Pelsub_P2133 [Pelolinea submarina]
MRISYFFCYYSRYHPKPEDYHWITHSNHLSDELRDSLKRHIFDSFDRNEQYCFFPLSLKNGLDYVGVGKRWHYGLDAHEGDINHSVLLLFRKVDWVLLNPTVFIQYYLMAIFSDIQEKYWKEENYSNDPIINSGGVININPDIPWESWKEFIRDYQAAECYTPAKFGSLYDIQALIGKNKLIPFQKAVSTYLLDFPYELFNEKPKHSFVAKRNFRQTYKPLLTKMRIEKTERKKMNEEIQRNLDEISRYLVLFKVSDSKYLKEQREKYTAFLREYRNNHIDHENDQKKLGEDIILAGRRLETDVSGLLSNRHDLYSYYVRIVKLCKNNGLTQKPCSIYNPEDSKLDLYSIIKRIFDLYGKTANLCLKCLAVWDDEEKRILENLTGLAKVGERAYFPRVLLEMPKPLIELEENSREAKKIEDNRAFPEQESVELTGKDPEENPEADLLPKSMKDSK